MKEINDPGKINVPTALIFFNRPEPLKVVFAAIRKAKPGKLFLIQDGSRKNNANDLKNIRNCREIVEQVDWDCEVYKNYSEENLGCGMRVSSGITWAFNYVDRLAIIEDDCVPSAGFYIFCNELLEKYKDDQRIDMICGMNNLEIYANCPDSYFFSKSGSIWGWATWKRVWDTYDYNFTYLNDLYVVNQIEENIAPRKKGKEYMDRARRFKKKLGNNEKLSSWSHQRGINMFMQSRLAIVPLKNLISNIGLTDDSAHFANSIKKMSSAMQKLFTMPVYNIEMPLIHPKYVMEEVHYRVLVEKQLKPNVFIKYLRKLEVLIRRIIYK